MKTATTEAYLRSVCVRPTLCFRVRFPGDVPALCVRVILATEQRLCAVVWDVCWVPSESGTALKNVVATHRPVGVTECIGRVKGGGGSFFFPLFTHSFLFVSLYSLSRAFTCFFSLSSNSLCRLRCLSCCRHHLLASSHASGMICVCVFSVLASVKLYLSN